MWISLATVTPAPASRPGSPEAAAERIAGWRAQLVAHSGPNTLLWSDHAVALDITHAHPGGLAKLLAGKKTRLTELYREPAARERAISRARAIRAKELELERERGVPGSFLAVGRATWTERRGPKPSAPVFLRPCEVLPHDARQTEFDVVATGELEFNPALRSFLESTGGTDIPFDVLVRMSVRTHGFDPTSAYEALNRAWAGPPGWRITPDMWLTTFPYAKLSAVAAFREVIAAAESHPLLGPLARGTALGPDKGRHFAPAEPEMPTVLDADPDQIAVLEAVRGGRTVVVDAGPGTGKSQTVVNIAADRALAGKRTLIVAASAGSRAAIAGRLAHAGLTGILRAPQAGAGSGPRRPSVRAAQVQSDWSSAGRELREHVSRMHRVHEPHGLSLHDLQERIAAVCEHPNPPRSKVRLPEQVLRAFGPEQVRQWSSDLQAAAADGAWPAADEPKDPWWGAQVADAADVSRALDAVTALSAERFAGFASDFRRTFDGIDVPAMSTLADHGEFIAGMGRLTRVLDAFRLGIFDAPLEEWAAADGSGAFGRWKHERAVKALLRPGASPSDLHALVRDALASRPLWQHVRGSRIMPGQVQGIASAQAAYDTLAEQASLVSRLIDGHPDLLHEPVPALHQRMAELAGAGERLHTLADTNADLARARKAGLGELIDDFAARRVSPEAVPTEVEFVWLASLLAQVTASDPGYARATGDHLRAARTRFQDVDRSLQAGHAAGIASSLDPSVPLIWLTSPYAVGLALPAGLSVDLVVVEDAQSLSVAEAAAALGCAGQALILGDSALPGPVPFTATARGQASRADRGPSLLAEAAALWPVHRLGWHYRSRDARLMEWPVAHAYAGTMRRFPAPRDTGAYRVEAAAITENDHGLVSHTVRAALLAARLAPKESLAVVTLTPEMADRIRTALAAAMDSSVEEFFADDGDEPFVVVDGAHATGLVRDAVLVVLGQTAPAEVAGTTGAALLTAALTRGRTRVAVLHTLDPAVVRESAGPGPARAGLRLLADALTAAPDLPTGEASVLLADLARRLKARGLRARPGILPGVVDLAVSDPFARGAGGLAIQTDGPAYAALGSTRMRDRLVHEQLRRLGWRPLKILNVDLFRDPAREEARIVAAMERLAAGDVRTGPIPRSRRASRPPTGGASIDGSANAAGGQTRDDTDAGWGEVAAGGDGRDRWIAEQRPPHWG